MSINPLNDISKVYLEQVSESAVPGKPAERLGAVTAIPKSEQEAARERLLAKTKAKREAMKTEALDPVGQEDADIDNDGDTDKSDKYLHKRRKAIGKAIAKKNVKEGYSNWRQDLAEVMNDEEDNKEIKEKKVNNKIKINPKLDEALEDIGGTLLEMVEIDEVDFIIESVYGELLGEGYDEDDIEEALEYALTEAKVTFGHDTDSPRQKKSGAGQLVKAVGRLARQKLSSKVRGAKASAKSAVARGARKVAKGALGVARKMEGGDKTPKTAERKPSTYRGAGAGTKEKVSSGSYTAPTKKKAEKPSDPWEGSATTPPKAKTKKTTAPKAKTPVASKRKKKSKLDSLLADIRSEGFEIDEGMTMKDFKQQRSRQKQKEKRAAEKTSPLRRAGIHADKASPERAARHRANVDPDYDYGDEENTYPGGKLKNPKKIRKAKALGELGEGTIQEKALSKQQQKFMGMVYAVKKGDMKAPSPEVAKAAAGMTKQQAKDFAKTKHKGLPEVKEAMDDSVEMSSTTSGTSPVDDKKMEQQRKKIQMQKVRDLTVRLAAARKGVY